MNEKLPFVSHVQIFTQNLQIQDGCLLSECTKREHLCANLVILQNFSLDSNFVLAIVHKIWPQTSSMLKILSNPIIN